MATPWFRVWGDMVNDPKWRTIARVSSQKIGDVIATYVHMMTLASNATERGRTQGWNDEDIGTALDINTEQVAAIREAMQGRVLDGDYLSGWEKRQPIKEDGAAERAKAWREAQKQGNKTQPNASKRNRTPEEIRIDKEQKDKTNAQNPDGFARFWSAYPKKKSKGAAEKAWKTIKPSEQVLEEILQAIERAKTSVDWIKEGGQFIPHPATWLRATGWKDEITSLIVGADGNVKQWWESASGITAKGKEYGLEQTEPVFAAFRHRVYTAAGDGPWNRRNGI